MNSKRRFLLSALSAALAPCAWSQTQAKFPSRAITWVVPYPAGGFGDALSRVLAQQLTLSLKQPVIVENKPGAGGQIAAAYVKQLPADGHTLFYGDIGPFAMNTSLYPRLSYDVQKDFIPLTRLLTSALVLVVPPNSPIKSLADLQKAAKSDKGLHYGSFGVGSQPHIWMEMLKRELGGNLQHVAYKGAAPALQDLMGGHIDAMLDVAANSLPHVREGKLRALAVVGTDKRLSQLPQVPTMGELGYAKLNTPGWTGVVLRQGTPAAVVEQLHAAVVKAIQSPEVMERFGDFAVTPAPQSPAEFSQFIQSETDRWGQVIKAVGVTLD
ncbi:tripartite tricarboxylate transporter substrate binding protein [Curvibacter sp. RS43]|uniref:Tripartite tricarboxylate transporter substrate binding protein n=1 Tax=Curvibacter microcysteis TaxID=3026419 RepID=A0ABT5MCP1_9BURK|nr:MULTISPECIES: tripartite tricarboxylate transporter substrate binding protein [unclassified Curvibacter]MDD0809236.1 tripartite tricarboxylate transporter substrate binding protein [Curvibacter sp. RS43]MDD0814343.1 tripartite tricarboxylate transporter substrate binding protein [Curvibacter sp. HBC28]